MDVGDGENGKMVFNKRICQKKDKLQVISDTMTKSLWNAGSI